MRRPVILDHSIVGQEQLTNFELRKDREYAACRICGDIFQSGIAIHRGTLDYTPIDRAAVAVETHNWRQQHNKQHTEKEHAQLALSGLFFTPEAAHRLAPYGIVAMTDLSSDEMVSAMREAPRAPVREVES